MESTREGLVTLHTVRAILPDATVARTVIEQLSRQGIDGGDLHLANPGGVPSNDTRASDRATDASVVRRLGSRMLLGAVIGAVVGAVAGALIFASAGGQPLLPGALGGAGGGAALGIIIGLMATPVMATAWEDANAPGPGVRHLTVTNVTGDELPRVQRLVARHARSVEVEPPVPGIR